MSTRFLHNNFKNSAKFSSNGELPGRAYPLELLDNEAITVNDIGVIVRDRAMTGPRNRRIRGSLRPSERLRKDSQS